ncbi:hypothetical protein AC578_9668 [Pseudocercospora eumusae]|uniref:Methyltransferase domain-containing protein n=1 Tax=Pseudocercospora eumusae TaxID=321146 RepID=A0A139HR22_9PEZI|nr:hypothetical protein AC578_9668 [Pseudocercospora eumusae]
MSRTRRSTLFQALCALVLVTVFVLLKNAGSHGDYEILPKWVTDDQSMTQDRYLHHANDLTRRYEECDWANLDVSGTSKCAEGVRYGDKVLCMLQKSAEDSKAEQSKFPLSIADMKSRYGWTTRPSQKSPTGIGLHDAFAALNIRTDQNLWTYVEQDHDGTTEFPATHATYVNSFSASQGTILAEMNFGVEWSYTNYDLDLQFPRDKIVPLKQWSDVMFNAMKDIISRQGPDAFKNFNIEHVFQHNLIDDDVLAVLKSVIQSDSLDRQDKRWPGYQFDISTPQARAVLSVANAKGVWWMLGSHKNELRLKTIDQVNIFECSKISSRNGETWCIYFHVVDVEQEPESDGDDEDGDGDGDD